MKTANKDNPFAFFYIEKKITQPSLIAGTPDITKEIPVGEYHIVHGGRLMCKESREVIRNREKGGKSKDAKVRPAGIKCCVVCDKAWRDHPDSPYHKFVFGSNPKTGIEPQVREQLREEPNHSVGGLAVDEGALQGKEDILPRVQSVRPAPVHNRRGEALESSG